MSPKDYRLDNSYFSLLVVAAAGIFTIVPETQYVYLNHNVTFECATNLTGYSLSFNHIFGGGSITPTSKQTNLPNGGIKVTTTFIVTSANNGTGVRFHAENVDTNILIYSSKVYAYAQGLYVVFMLIF